MFNIVDLHLRLGIIGFDRLCAIWYIALDLFYVTHFKITGHDKSLFVPKECGRKIFNFNTTNF